MPEKRQADAAKGQRLNAFNLEKGLAIQGYDPVAYFKQSKPVKGQETISYDWNGVKWLFSSEENKEDFKANPEKFFNNILFLNLCLKNRLKMVSEFLLNFLHWHFITQFGLHGGYGFSFNPTRNNMVKIAQIHIYV